MEHHAKNAMNSPITTRPILESNCSSARNRCVTVIKSTGFISRALVMQLMDTRGAEVLALTRALPANPALGAKYIEVRDETTENRWQSVPSGAHTVVHTAVRAHVLSKSSVESLAEFQRVNLAGTLLLAKRAAAMSVKHVVFLSSIDVNGLSTALGKAFSEVDQTKPHNAYALSKCDAEQSLLRPAQETGLEVVIIRPSLVYDRNAPGNFGALMRAVRRGWPLPLGAIHNQRSLVELDNLVDFIITRITRSHAANQNFLVSDGRDLSTTELVRGMARSAGVPARLLPMPMWILQVAGTLLGKGDAVQRICSSLLVDISKARTLLGWTPPVSVEEGLRRAMGFKA